MARQSTHSRNHPSIATLAIVGLVLSILFRIFNRMIPQSCNLLDQTAWIALQILRAVVAHLFPGSCVLQHLPDLGTSILALLCLIIGWPHEAPRT